MMPSEQSFADEKLPNIAEPIFHSATTEAELALDRAIRLSDSDRNAIDFLAKRPRDNSSDERYAGIFTSKLEKAWASEEQSLVQSECGGRYLDGEICGLDYNPFTCAQDFSENGYRYASTPARRSDAMIVALVWPGIDRMVATYRMVRKGNRWLVDGVRCEGGRDFNMK